MWDGKPDKVKKKNLITRQYDKGGLHMVDYKSYLMSLKHYRLVNGKFANWKLIPFKYIKVSYNISFIFNMNLDDLNISEYFE